MLDIKRFALEVMEKAKENLQTHKELMPVAFLVGTRALVIGTPFENEEQKLKCYAAIGLMASKAKADFIVFLTDTFYREIDPKLIKDEMDEMLERPAFYPASHKREAILVSIFYLKENKNLISMTNYKREGDKFIFEKAGEFIPSTPEKSNMLDVVMKAYKSGEEDVNEW